MGTVYVLTIDAVERDPFASQVPARGSLRLYTTRMVVEGSALHCIRIPPERQVFAKTAAEWSFHACTTQYMCIIH